MRTEPNYRARLTTSQKDWKRFVSDEPHDESSGVSREINQSWVRSRAAGVSVTERHLPPVTTKDKSLVNRGYTDYTAFLHERFSDFFHKGERLLSSFGGVGLWMDNHLQVFHKIGDDKLMDELREANIKYGTSFREDRMGTNAVALADIIGHETWVVGNENYHNALKNYATCSSPRMRQGFVEGFMMLVFPVEGFDQAKIDLCEFMIEAFYHLYDDSERLERASHDMIIRASMKRTESCYFVCDGLGRLIEASDEFYQVMHITPQLSAGKPVDSILAFSPSLSDLAKKKEGVYPCTITELRSGTVRRYTTESFPITVNSSPSTGILFILTSEKSVSAYIQKIASKSPYITFDQILGTSEPLRSAIELAKAAAKSPSNILIQGDSGTGKELFAQAIHTLRFPNIDKPFIALNCGGLPRDLLNSELFGYVEGAFTGAKKGGAPGKFELANGGTLFLDEIGEMPLEMQSILLRVLEEKAVTRTGGSTRIPVDVRILSATNRDLLQMVQEGTFRLDLYYRLNVLSVRIPSLKERKRDILTLANHFIQEFSSEIGKNIIGATAEYEQYLLSYEWPGNVRELKNVIERSVNLENGPLLSECAHIKSLLENAQVPPIIEEQAPERPRATIAESYADYEKQRIRELMILHNGNKSKVAVEMGVSRKTLYNKMHRYGMSIN